MESEQVSQKRQVARKVRLKDLSEGTYVRVDGKWDPNFIQTSDGRKFSRVNVVAIVASEPVPDLNFNTFIIDDGSARIPVRIFDNLKTNVVLGDAVLMVGRPREFNQQTYLVPEIIKKIENNQWILHRKLELEQEIPQSSVVIEKPEEVVAKKNKEEMIDEKEPISNEITAIDEKEVEETVDSNTLKQTNPVDKLIETIKDLDKGEGAEIEEVISIANVTNAENIIENLLKEGEIFEITSGMIKVLE